VDDIANMLANGGLSQQIPLRKVHKLSPHSFSFEKTEDGKFLLHLDLVLSPHCAERYTIGDFEPDAWEDFKTQAEAAGSAVKIERNLRGLH
jgi:hypothetical protein